MAKQNDPSTPSGRGGRASRVLVLLGLVVVALLITLAFVRPTSVSTAPDQVALHYSDGAFTPKRFKDCVESSRRQWDGPGDRHYSYPSSQTNFVFDDGDSDGAPITFVTKDGIEMTVEGVANLMLNTDCDALRGFHDLIGNRYVAYMDGDERSPGWNRMLSVYIARPLDTAIDRAGQKYTYTDLYTDPNVKAQWEADVVAALPDLVNRQTDGEVDFFENFAITLQKPEPPQAIKDALIAQQEAVARARASEAEAAAKQKAAEAQVAVEKAEAAKIQERINVLGRDGYLRQYAIDKGLNPYQPTTSGIIPNR
ncbi:SPFH domain-containing protein [Nocardioides sp. 616]|uniref:SPFH domain-containing protein n=1 Tax=Nocardioides sp. 616 TaxID=2268090 RepID=UPI000CE51745|nr:SPFH domain-containing protein [Nocardioides sp. 616]